ncbi:hypothetical protein KFE25_012715 [Diacronema lutheri]|uniref:Fructose-bisphosphate aldolase n=1 Tax=Diacronema lutheri TaxID=2081491 RepID=A0A8J5X7W2_DIALT|nr:hypothetical protein KFE25_012715 [Diacronema lutheri]
MSAYPPPAKCSFASELVRTATSLAAAGKGILAGDESTGTIGKRFAQISLENTLENRRAYRDMLMTTPGLGEYLSGWILFEETLLDVTRDGKGTTADLLTAQGIVPGVKVDKGVVPLPGTSGETLTQGLDDLGARCDAFYEAGARFAKWRAVLHVDEPSAAPSELAIRSNMDMLARYAAICQVHGLVPLVEPEVLMGGRHSLETAMVVTERVLATLFKTLADHHVFLEGALLKPNMCRPGEDAPAELHASPAAIALATYTCMRRTVPAAMPGIFLLSGGMSEEEATVVLSEMNKLACPKPWSLSFSYGRALQTTSLRTWAGKEDNEHAAKKELLVRAKANALAARGKYNGEASRGAAGAPDGFVPEF